MARSKYRSSSHELRTHNQKIGDKSSMVYCVHLIFLPKINIKVVEDMNFSPTIDIGRLCSLVTMKVRQLDMSLHYV